MKCSLGVAVSYLFIFLLLVISYGSNNFQCQLPSLWPKFDYEYYQDGDVIIAGMISAHSFASRADALDRVDFLDLPCSWVQTEKYRSILSFIFAVDEINKDPNLLPNITLGYHIVDTCGDSLLTAHAVFRMLTGKKRRAPNYSCMGGRKVAAFAVDSQSQTSNSMLPILNLYKYTQLTYGVSDPILHDRNVHLTSYQFAPDDRNRYHAIVTLMKDCKWNWIGIITTGEESNEMEVKELRQLMAKYEICIEFIINIEDTENARRQMSKIDKSTTEVVVICGQYSKRYQEFIIQSKRLIENVTLILHESWINILYRTKDDLKTLINCSLVYMVKRRKLLKVEKSIHHVNPSIRPNDPLLEEIWFKVFRCLTKHEDKNHFYEWYYQHSGMNCTETYYIPPSEYDLQDTSLYYTYVSVYILAHALNTMQKMGNTLSTHQLHLKLQKYMKYVYFKDPSGNYIFFDNRGETFFDWIIENWVIYRAETEGTYDMELLHLATFRESPRNHYTISVKSDKIVWKNDRVRERNISSLILIFYVIYSTYRMFCCNCSRYLTNRKI